MTRVLKMDVNRHEVALGDKKLDLSNREWQLLNMFMRHPGTVLTRDRIMNALWPEAVASELDSRTIDQHVARLRKKMGLRIGKEVIQTISCYGYKLTAKATITERPEPS